MIDVQTRNWVRELARDSVTSGRLTAWERTFMADMAARLIEWELDAVISDKQQEALLRIEEKIYAAG